MSAAEALPQPDASSWIIRPFASGSADEEALYYMLGITYARSRAGARAGASRVGRREQPDVNAVAQQRAFLATHRPIWTWLMQHADIALVVDPEAPQIIWAWLVTSGPDVVHALGVKRSLVENGLAQDVVRDLVGDRLSRHQVCTLELPQMRTRGGNDAIGIDRPREWSLDPTWLLTRMMGDR